MKTFVCSAIVGMSVLSGPALAQCVTEADLSRGVEVRFLNGDWTTMQRQDGGYLQITEYYADGSTPIRFRAHRGVYFVQEYEIDAEGRPIAGTRLDIEFSQDPALLPHPVPGARWQGPTVNLFEEGGSRNEITTAEFSATDDVTLSGCTYEAVEVSLRYDWGADGGLSLIYHFLPEVGTAYIVQNQFDGDTLNTTVATAIGPMSK